MLKEHLVCLQLIICVKNTYKGILYLTYMKCLITGITGFLGPHLAQLLLSKGYEVHGLLRGTRGSEQEIKDLLDEREFAEITFHYGDIIHFRTMDRLFKDHIFDVVFHLAAQTHPPTSFKDPIGTWETNVMGSINLITCLQDHQPDCHFVYCSTVEVYGNEGIDGRKITEMNTILPANPYGASKCAIDLYVCERMKNKQMTATVIRPFCFTGPRRGARFSIASDAVQIAQIMLDTDQKDKKLRIGNLDTTRAVTDVRDIAMAFYLVAKNKLISNGKVYNVCGGEPLKMREYTNMLIKFSGLRSEDVEMVIDQKLWRPIDIQYQDGDASLIKKELGWTPTIPIERTIRDLLTFWYQKLKVMNARSAFLVDYSGVEESYGGTYRYYYPNEIQLPDKYKEHVFIVYREDLYDDIMFDMFTTDFGTDEPTLSELIKHLKPSKEWYPIFPALAQLLENALVKSEYKQLREIYNYYREVNCVVLDVILRILRDYEVPDDEIVTLYATLRYFTPT